MKSIANLGTSLAAHPVIADDLVELHAARLLLLFRVCGKKDRIEGLTKLAKLDFFVRYPEFFAQVCEHLGSKAAASIKTREIRNGSLSLRPLGQTLLSSPCLP